MKPISDNKTKNPAAVALGRLGGKKTAKNRTREERVAAAKKAIQSRWLKKEQSK